MSQPEGLRVTLLQGRPQRTRDHFRMGGKSSAQTLRVFSLSLNTSLPITPLVRPCASRCAWNIVDRKTISGLVFYRHSATGHVQWKRPLGTSEAAFALSPIRTADASRATFLSPTSHTFSKTPSPPTAATSPAHGHTDGGSLPEELVSEGWKRYESRSTGRYFFRNRLTGEVQWTLPEPKGVHTDNATTLPVVTSPPVARNIVSAYMDSPGEQDVPLQPLSQPQSRRAMLREQQEMTKKLKQQLRAATPGAAEEPGYIGLEITKTPPHAVVAVNDIVDENRVRQDCPGYGNPRVRPGDRLLAIDSAKCERVSVQCIHNLLRGAAGSIVELTLARSQGGSVYNVRALRHGIHEFSKHAPRPPPSVAAPHNAVSAVSSDVANGKSPLWRSRPPLQEVDDRAPETSARAKAATRDLVTSHEPRIFSLCIGDANGQDIVGSEASRGDDAPELGETVASTGAVLEDRDVEKMKREMGEGDRRMSRLDGSSRGAAGPNPEEPGC